MKSFVSENKREVLVRARAVTRRLGMPIPTQEDIIEDEGIFYVDLEITDSIELPLGLSKRLLTTKAKNEKILNLKKPKEHKSKFTANV